MPQKNEKVLLFEPSRCTGCRCCEIACSFRFYEESSLDKSHIRHVFDEKEGSFEAVYCQHCEDPVCLAACKTDAIKKDEASGIVKIDSLKCIGCQSCNFACPISAPRFDPDRKVSVKCNLCGGDPVCVDFCSSRAIRYVNRDERNRFMEEYGKEA